MSAKTAEGSFIEGDSSVLRVQAEATHEHFQPGTYRHKVD